MGTRRRFPPKGPLSRAILVAAGYYVLATVGVHLTLMPEGIAILWPPNAVLLVALLLSPIGHWWILALAAMAAEFAADLGSFPVWQIAGFALVNICEAGLAALAIGKLDAPRQKAMDLRRAAVLVGVVLFLATPLAALGGAYLYFLADPTIGFWTFWRLWWFGDAVGLTVLAPTFLVWLAPTEPIPDGGRLRSAEIAGLTLVLAVMAVVIFGVPPIQYSGLSPALLLPVLVWAAVRFGPRGGTLAALGVAVVAMAGTTAGHGPFADRADERAMVLATQEFLMIATLVTLALGLARDRVTAAIREAERANRAKTEFLHSMSHELRTPLNAVLGFSDLATARAEKARCDPKIGDYLVHVREGGRHLLALVEQIMAFSQLGVDLPELEIRRLDLNEAVGRAMTMLEPEAAARHVELNNDMPETTAPTVRGDAVMVDRILLNLLANAVRYNREGGRVRIRTEETGDGFVRLGVEDTGPGLLPADLRAAFEPFNRVGRESGTIAGVGLGLPLVARLAQAMGGRAGADSRLGHGSRFWVDLPTAGSTGNAVSTEKGSISGS